MVISPDTEQEVLEVRRGRQHEKGSAKPPLQIALHFVIVDLHPEYPAHGKPEKGNRDEPADQSDDWAHDGLVDKIAEDSGDGD